METELRLHHEESVSLGIRRLARDQIDRALTELADSTLDRHEAIHQVRKRCKKLRAILRLVRGELAARENLYSFENAWFRDTARLVSYLRDAEALIEAHDRLMAGAEGQTDTGAFAPFREALLERKRRIEGEVDLDERLAVFADRLHQARGRIGSWPLRSAGFNALEPGLRRTYRRGRKAMARARVAPGDETLHDWRKRVKYHWYHVRILEGIWTPVMAGLAEGIRALSDLLGNDHDLAVLTDLLGRPDGEMTADVDAKAYLGLVRRRRQHLQAAALAVGDRLYFEKPRRLSARLRACWDAWKADQGDAAGDPAQPGDHHD